MKSERLEGGQERTGGGDDEDDGRGKLGVDPQGPKPPRWCDTLVTNCTLRVQDAAARRRRR